MERSWTSYGTIFAFLAFAQSFINTFLPYEVQRALKRLGRKLYSFFSNNLELKIDEYDGTSLNELFSAAQIHLSDVAAKSAKKVNVALPKNASAPIYSLAENERIIDSFKGVGISWEFVSYERKQPSVSLWDRAPDEKRSLHMLIHKKDKGNIVAPYIQHILDRAKLLKLKNRDRLLFTNMKGGSGDHSRRGKLWDSVPFKHPSTFETLALDAAMKKKIVDDLYDFASGEEFYRKAGRAWKRGYLLYGPPGTGKSSMIAAIANLLQYDIYDLELTDVKSNAMLRKLLIQTSNKSILVIEDIDCSLDLSDRMNKSTKSGEEHRSGGAKNSESELSQVTLSGLLNFTDGLWSCCGSERIIVFTTNHIEKVDQALLRSGRMDMHIHMTYCTFEAFRVLARNYLGIEEHELMGEVEGAMEGAEMTPADVSEVLIREKRDKAEALRCLIRKLRECKAKARAAEQQEASGGADGEEVAVMEEEKRAVAMEKTGAKAAGMVAEKCQELATVAEEKRDEIKVGSETEEEEKRAVAVEKTATKVAEKGEEVAPPETVAEEKGDEIKVGSKTEGAAN